MSNGPQFYETQRGRIFFESTLPSLVKAVNRLAKAIEENNKLMAEGEEPSEEETEE